MAPFTHTDRLILSPAWISDYICYKVWDEITKPFLNFNGATVELISSHTSLCIWLLIHTGIKGSNMIVCVSLVSNSRGCCLARRGETTWCHHFSTPTNILLIKSNLKFESRTTAVSVTMSPRYLGGKYRSRLHTRSRKKRASFFAEDWACEIELRQTGVICFPWRQRGWSCGVFKSWISDAHCPF